VNGSGKLGGSGRIGGNLVNQGSVNGGLQVAGNYQQSADGTLNVTLNNPLRVTGNAALDGTLNLAPPSASYVVKQQETLLTSGGGVSGQFSQVNTGVFLDGSVSYDAHSVTGQLTRKNTAAAAQAMGMDSASAQQTSRNLEQAFELADRWQGQATLSSAQQSALAAAGAFQTLADTRSAQAAINSLSGQAHASGNAVLFNALDYQTRLLNNRIDDASEQGRFGFWLESGQLRGSLDQDGYLGNRYRNTLTALGADSDFGLPGLRLGIAWTHTQLDATYDDTGGNSQNSLQGVMLYGRYAVTPAWYWQGNLSYQHGRDNCSAWCCWTRPRRSPLPPALTAGRRRCRAAIAGRCRRIIALSPISAGVKPACKPAASATAAARLVCRATATAIAAASVTVA
jgi:Uncharacterized protein with a C-terminal OMP (outer membrane protein) domain